eukprot:3477054-Amphidinium_carterae.1
MNHNDTAIRLVRAPGPPPLPEGAFLKLRCESLIDVSWKSSPMGKSPKSGVATSDHPREYKKGQTRF